MNPIIFIFSVMEYRKAPIIDLVTSGQQHKKVKNSK